MNKIVGQPGDLRYPPNFDGSDTRSWNPGGDLDCRVEIAGIDQEVTADLFSRLRKRTISHEGLPIANPDAGRLGCRMQGRSTEVLAGSVKLVCELNRLLDKVLPLDLTTFGEGVLIMVNQ